MSVSSVPGLEVSACRNRVERLRALMATQQLDAVLLTNRHYVYWATGYWQEFSHVPVAVLVPLVGDVIVLAHSEVKEELAADEVVVYKPHKLCTLLENMPQAAAEALRSSYKNLRRIGVAQSSHSWLSDSADWIDITTEFQYLRRKKDADEVGMIRHSILAAEHSYTKAREILRPGLSELELFAEMQAAATVAVGEPLSGWGNDFQFGTAGGPPRLRKAKSGDLAILDIGVGVRGYRCDLCRTFTVDGDTTELQQEAHQHVMDVLTQCEQAMQPGASCADLFETARGLLDGWHGYTFFHHLGHGIGLDEHEVPRLNLNWDDLFEVGDLVAVEPGVYDDKLNGGVRLEHNYLITDEGVECLSNFPLDL